MKFTVVYTGQFKRSLKKCAKRGLNIKTLTDALDILQETGTLPPKYKSHCLVGDYAGCWSVILNLIGC